jgi:hypothetical protein
MRAGCMPIWLSRVIVDPWVFRSFFSRLVSAPAARQHQKSGPDGTCNHYAPFMFAGTRRI